MANVKKIDLISIDLGNLTTIGVSSNKEILIESRIKKYEGGIDLLSTNEIFEYENEKYIINDGKYENDILKFKKDNYLMLLYYTIAKCTDNNNVNLVTCIPASRYKSRKEEMEEFIKENNKKTVVVDNKKRTINICDVKIIPEGYSTKANREVINQIQKNCGTIVFDIGGLTTDLIEFDNNINIQDANSINLGLLNLYNSCREYINITYDLSLSLEQCKDIFEGKQNLMCGNFEYRRELIKKFIVNLINEVKANYPNLKNSNIILIGGGAEILSNVMKQLYPQTIIITDIRTQARDLYKVGEKIFNHK